MLMIWPVFIALVVSPLLSCFGVSLFVVCCVLPLVECASPVDYDRCIRCVFDEIHTDKVLQSWYIRNDEPRKCWWFLAELLSTTFQQTLELQSVDVSPGWGHLTLQYLSNWLRKGHPVYITTKRTHNGLNVWRRSPRSIVCGTHKQLGNAIPLK